MDFVIHNLRLQELVAIARENKRFYDDFVAFIHDRGYASVLEFVQEPADEKAAETITYYLSRPSQATLYDGLLRPYPAFKAKWFFLAWLFRDAATQRLEPLLKSVPGETMLERRTHLLNETRKFVEPLFPLEENWEWAAISEVMIARLEGSKRALKGTRLEELVRKSLGRLIESQKLPLEVSERQVKIGGETYDVQIKGAAGSVLLPVKTRASHPTVLRKGS